MKTIFVFNDNSPEAAHAAEFALVIAQKMQANILLANMVRVNNKVVVKVSAGGTPENVLDEPPMPGTCEHLKLLNNIQTGFEPEIEEFDISDMDESKVAELINREQIWMMVKGTRDVLLVSGQKRNLNVHTVLNNVLCPLLLIPESWPVKHMERLIYIADLRYCNIPLVRFLAELAKPWHAYLSIANMSKSGLPDMTEKYALSVFNEEVCSNVNYDRLFLNNIREKNLKIAIDVLISGLQNDLLVFVNRCFHFKEILGMYITDALPLHITIPLVIFPG
jgi:hypothetical protein